MIQALDIPAPAERFLEQKTASFVEKSKQSISEMPGAKESVERLKNSGFRLAIGTSLDKQVLSNILNHLDVSDAFDVIVTGDQIKHGKPDPETYITVSEKLHVFPNQCVVLEDAASGIKSAKAAGAYCIAVENSDAITQDTSAADAILSSLEKLTPSFIDSLESK